MHLNNSFNIMIFNNSSNIMILNNLLTKVWEKIYSCSANSVDLQVKELMYV